MANDELINPGSYISPGYAVSSTIDDILNQHRLEKRQAMLDALNKEKIDADIYETRTRADAYKAQQEAEAQWRKSQAGDEFLKHFSKGQTVGDGTLAKAKEFGVDDFFPSSPQDTYKAGVPYSYQEGSGGADDSGNVLPERVAPEAHQYVGSPNEQKEAAIDSALSAYLASGQGDPETNEGLRQALMIRKMGVPVQFSGESFMKPRKPATHEAYVWDPTSGKRIDTGSMNDGDTMAIGSRPPQPRETRLPQGVKEELDPKTGLPTGKYVGVGPDGNMMYVPNPAGVGPTSVPPPHKTEPPVLSAQELNNFNNPSNGPVHPTRLSSGWVNARAQMRPTLIATRTDISQLTKNALNDYFKHAGDIYLGAAPQDIAKNYVAQGLIPPAEENKFVNLVWALSDPKE